MKPVVVAGAVVVVIGVLVLVMWHFGGGQSSSPATNPPAQAITPNSLETTDIKVGTGAMAQSGAHVTVSYVGTLTNGTQFDASSSFPFQLGVGQVIKGWDQGLIGMKVGGERKLVIPPDLAYGSEAVGKIPANSTLIFDVKLLSVQ